MRGSRVIISILVVATGVAVGLGGVWYLRFQASANDPVASSGGSVAINDSTGAPDGTTNTVPLSLTGPAGTTNAGTSDNMSTNSKNNTGNSYNMSNNSQNINNNSSVANSSYVVPTQTELTQYDADYKSKDAAMFGDIKVGDGAVATSGKSVVVNYIGWLTNGQIFDQSYTTATRKGQPFTFLLGKQQVITGWDNGIAGMKVGGRRRLIVPPAVGYGAKGYPPIIPGDSLLVFDVELLAVQ